MTVTPWELKTIKRLARAVALLAAQYEMSVKATFAALDDDAAWGDKDSNYLRMEREAADKAASPGQ